MIDGYLTLVAPEEGLVYDGTEKGGVTVEGIVPNVTIPEIVYSGDRINVTEEGFNASITLGGVTLTLNVKIQPKELSVAELTVYGGYYGDEYISVYDTELEGVLAGDYVYFYPDQVIPESSEIGQYTTVKGIVGGELSGDDAANYCLPEGLETIGADAFAGCEQMQAICIPASVTSIASGCFDDCTSLMYIIYSGNFEDWNALYSDYYAVAKKYNMLNPDFFADMAMAFINDQDAVKNKAAVYYECIVEK
jgi:hypothetical protein